MLGGRPDRGHTGGVFTGLSAFPLTPVSDTGPDLDAYSELVAHLAEAGVDSLGVLGSTGGYAYLNRQERREVAFAGVRAAGSTPVIVGVGAMTTRDVLACVEDAHEAGAAGLLLPPLGYQPLRPAEVFALVERVTAESELPVVVYDNPGTTGFTFTEELHARIAALPGVVSVKLPPVEDDPALARSAIARMRGMVPTSVTLGVSGDGVGARGLLAGCDTWYSVLAGVLPRTCMEITRAALAGQQDRATALSTRLDPVWDLFSRFGSYRVASALAAEIGLVTPESLHHPVLPLTGDDREAVRRAIQAVGDLG